MKLKRQQGLQVRNMKTQTQNHLFSLIFTLYFFVVTFFLQSKNCWKCSKIQQRRNPNECKGQSHFTSNPSSSTSIEKLRKMVIKNNHVGMFLKTNRLRLHQHSKINISMKVVFLTFPKRNFFLLLIKMHFHSDIIGNITFPQKNGFSFFFTSCKSTYFKQCQKRQKSNLKI